MGNPLDDQDAARRHEAARHCSAMLARAGVPAVVHSRTVWITLLEEAELADGIMPPSLQMRLDRQNADDAVIQAIENAEQLPQWQSRQVF